MAWPSLASTIARLVAGASVAGAATFAMSGAGQYAALDWDAISALGQRLAGDAALWAEAGYRRRPAVMIGLAGLVALPVIALIGLVLHRFLARPAAIVSLAVAPVEELPRLAWLELDDRIERPVAIRRELVQIGRESEAARSCSTRGRRGSPRAACPTTSTADRGRVVTVGGA